MAWPDTPTRPGVRMNTPAPFPPPTAFVEFKNVWLAYNDELHAKGIFAVEDINQIGRAHV